MKVLSFISSTIVLPVVGAYLVSPPGTAAPGTSSECSKWVEYSSSLTCALIEEYYSITEAEFEAWNPIVTELGSSCSLVPDLYYCVQIDYETSTVSSTAASSSTTFSTVAGTTSSGDGISTPSPIQTGMVSNCDQFYLVVSGDTCSTIASNEGISLTDFYAWNPAVGTSCEYLGLGDYVCVDIIGYTPSTTTATSTTTTTAGNGITTPTPIQTGMASNCDLFYLVVSGDTCSTIASNEGVGLSDFYAWNPAVGTSCQYLGLGDYVCVGVIATTSITTTTTTGDGITTPTPIQTGMVATCDSFYLVVSGDQCGTIASNEGISLADFYAWNPAVGTSCQYLGLGDYVCVGVIGATSTTTSTTTTGDGITTPTPIQTGMVTNCDSFYLVVSGDECGTIATEYGISLTDFYAWNPAVGSSCQYLGLGDYVCVSIL